MGGAANVASSILALAKLKTKINVKGFIPLCENMPGNNGKYFNIQKSSLILILILSKR